LTGVGIILGASIFVQPSEVSRHVPSILGTLLVWLACGLLTLCGALVCAELPHALQLAVGFAGAGQILAGSDYAHQIGSIEQMLASIRALEVSEAARAAILGGNAARLLKP
jgi:hypothetical protein